MEKQNLLALTVLIFDGHLVDFDEAIKRSATYRKQEREAADEYKCHLFEVLTMPNMKPEKHQCLRKIPLFAAEILKEEYGYISRNGAGRSAKDAYSVSMHLCMTGCPVQVQIPNFIKCIIDGDMELAYDTIRQNQFFALRYAVVWSLRNASVKKCVRGIKHEAVGIGRLERYVADWKNEKWLASKLKRRTKWT